MCDNQHIRRSGCVCVCEGGWVCTCTRSLRYTLRGHQQNYHGFKPPPALSSPSRGRKSPAPAAHLRFKANDQFCLVVRFRFRRSNGSTCLRVEQRRMISHFGGAGESWAPPTNFDKVNMRHTSRRASGPAWAPCTHAKRPNLRHVQQLCGRSLALSSLGQCGKQKCIFTPIWFVNWECWPMKIWITVITLFN